MAAATNQIVDNFHNLYYYQLDGTWRSNTFWMGVRTQKCPLDLWVYQEIIHETRPDVIIECGSLYGGSALFLASMCDLVGNGRVISIDVMPYFRPKHRRVSYILGSSTAPAVVESIRQEINGSVMAILDSAHDKGHVLDEMRAYAPMVTSYLIVEDTNVNGHPVAPDFGPGPMEAVNEFLTENDEFKRDDSREKFLLSFNPGGWLKRVS